MKSAGKFEKLGLRSGFDFVLHLPLRYEDETRSPRRDAAPQGRPVQRRGKVLKAQVMYRPKRQLVVHAEGLVLRFFNFYPSQLKQFQRAAEQGLLVRAFGEVRPGFFGAEMAHPRYRIVPQGEPLPDDADADLSDHRGPRAGRAARARAARRSTADRSRTRCRRGCERPTALQGFADSVRAAAPAAAGDRRCRARRAARTRPGGG